jgi:GT2 family glycosyltransferase
MDSINLAPTTTNQAKHVVMDFIFKLSDTILLCCGDLQTNLTGKEEFLLNGIACQKPYIAGILPLDSGAKTFLIIRSSEGNQFDDYAEISIQAADSSVVWYHNQPMAQSLNAFQNFLSSLNQISLTKILWLLVRLSSIDSSVTKYQHYVELCLSCHRSITPITNHPPSSFWLLPNVMYMELLLPVRDYKKARLLMLNEAQILGATISLVALHSDVATGLEKYAALVVFPHGDAILNAHNNLYALITNDASIALNTPIGANETNLEGLIAYIASFPENVRLSLRDFLTRELARLIVNTHNEKVASIIKTLQTYFLPNHSSICSREFPFGANIELAFPLRQDYIFISGWLHDPLELVDSIVLSSDLGFAISLKGQLEFYHRPDIAPLFEDSNFKITDEQCGFVALLDFPEELRKQIPLAIETFAYRFTVKLKSGLQYNIAPKAINFTPLALRGQLLEQLYFVQDLNAPAFEIMRQAASYLNVLYNTNAAKVAAIKQYGIILQSPKASIIIPLYQNLDYVALQIAHFANDNFMSDVEIIYVLDSPAQEKYLSEMLAKLSSLYGVNIKLLVLSCNAGFATACNLGAANAASDYLLFLNSDVVPTRYGWLASLLDAYSSNKLIGALAPKLLYEDDSLQHAGMYFALDHSATFYENLHYYKGYPAAYQSSLLSRNVPAVTAACLLIDKQKFNNVDGFSTDYIIGDFEDSDLCLKLLKNGLINYYFAEESLYHFERQSMNIASNHSHSRYLLNAMTQNKKWHQFIAEVVIEYGE